MEYRPGVQPSRDLPALPAPRHISRWRVVKDLVSFQIKLTLEGLKDIVLVPLSLAAAIIGLLVSAPDRGRHLRKVMRLGRGYDEWIHLYSALERSDAPALPPGSAPGDATPDTTPGRDTNLDAYLARLESALAAHSRRGGLTARARVAIERALDVLDTPPSQDTSRNNPKDPR